MRYPLTISVFVVFFVAELVAGIVSNSLSLQADAFHLLSDVMALIVGWTSVKLSKRDSTVEYTYGWLRSPIIGTTINTTFLLSVCFMLLINIIQRLAFTEDEATHPHLIVGVGIAGLVANICGMMLFHSHDDHNSHSVWLHLVGDTLGSIVVVINGVLMLIFEDASFVRFVDPIASLCIIIGLTFSSVKLLKSSIRILLHHSPNTEKILDALYNLECVQSIHHFHTFYLDEKTIVATMHASETSGSLNSTNIITKINECLHTFNIDNSVIQLEKEGECYDCVSDDCILSKCCVQEKNDSGA